MPHIFASCNCCSDFEISIAGETIELQWNFPIADIPNTRQAMNSGQNVQSQMGQSFWNYLPIADTSR